MGFIGRHLIKKLPKRNYKIVCVDNLSTQIHGNFPNLEPFDDDLDIVYIRDDINNIDEHLNKIKDVDTIINMASETGTGQSMYQIQKYLNSNIVSNSKILELIVQKKIAVKNYILLSSRAVYGQGKYFCSLHGVVYPDDRSVQNMAAGQFELICPICRQKISLCKSKEEDFLKPISIYGITKQVQEQILGTISNSTGINTIILRLQNVYGAGQSDVNPYTGVLNTFVKSLHSGIDINLYEDGKILRNFINVQDIATAIIKSLTLFDGRKINEVINIGAQQSLSLLEVKKILAKVNNKQLQYIISGDYRLGDVRHAIVSIEKQKQILDFEPVVDFSEGVNELSLWLKKRSENIKRLENFDDGLNLNSKKSTND
jgi:dTDP-L-rhamnose 4-epimerase